MKMSREEAIAIIRKEYLCVDRDCDIDRSCGKCDLMIPSKEPILEAYKMAIKALEQEPRWIPVSEKLPEEYGEYMITWVSDYTNKPLISIAEYEITDDFDRKNCRFLGEWLFDEYMSAYTNIKVTAWMPLPEPPKEGDTDDPE